MAWEQNNLTGISAVLTGAQFMLGDNPVSVATIRHLGERHKGRVTFTEVLAGCLAGQPMIGMLRGESTPRKTLPAMARPDIWRTAVQVFSVAVKKE